MARDIAISFTLHSDGVWDMLFYECAFHDTHIFGMGKRRLQTGNMWIRGVKVVNIMGRLSQGNV
jgi:hypothetical protein